MDILATLTIPIARWNGRRQSLGMSHGVVAHRSGVSLPTVKRILGGRAGEASFANVVAVAAALGVDIDFSERDAEEMCDQQARMKAARVARMVQGTSALEGQAVDATAYAQMVEQSRQELLAGSDRRLWSA